MNLSAPVSCPWDSGKEKGHWDVNSCRGKERAGVGQMYSGTFIKKVMVYCQRQRIFVLKGCFCPFYKNCCFVLSLAAHADW